MNIFEELNFTATLNELKKDMPTLKEYYITASQCLHNYFEALVKAGFTRKEALRIIIAHGYSPESSSLGTPPCEQGFTEQEERPEE